MSSYYVSNYNSKEENLLIKQYLIRRESLTSRHKTEVFDSETNNESATFKAQVQLRHTIEIINLNPTSF
jgi:hypothetical protein